MAVTGRLYGSFPLQALRKEHHLIDDDIRAQIHTSLYVPNQDTHDYKDDLTNEVTGTGYTAGGIALAGKTLTYTAATNLIVFDANDIKWAGSTITGRTVVIYNNTPALASAKGLVGYQQETVNIISSGGDWEIVWPAAGIVEIEVKP